MKIINIASSDNFEDILESVRESKLSSVILVVPRSNRVFKSRNKIEKLKEYFDRLKKEVSIISSGQEILKNANLAGFNIIRDTEKMSGKKDKDILSLYSEALDEPSRIKTKPKGVKLEESKKFVFILLGSAILLFTFIVLVSLSEAKIKIVPRKNDFSVSIPVIISDKITANDEIYGMVPGQWIEVEKTVSKTFVSTAEKDVFQKARGAIIIYNNFSASPQILTATTRFQTPEGLVFRTPKTITVPGFTKIGDNLKPGEIEIGVVADRAGEEYNIAPSDFRIPGFLGSPKYQGFYAKSFEKFSGGFVGRASFVSKEELEKGEKTVQEEGIQEIKTELASLGNFHILDEAVSMEIERTADSNNAGDLVKEFRVGVKVKAKTLIFKEGDIVDFISRYIKNSRNLSVIKNNLRINYDGSKLNEEKKELSFKLVSSGQTIQDINKNKIIADIAGERKDEAGAYLNNLSEVESAEIIVPFWLRKIPKDSSKINIEIMAE